MKEFNLPEKAVVNKFIPKSKIFEKSKVNSKIQQKFVDTIQRITWAYKLAEKTINIAGTDGIKEMQIFKVQLKKKTIPQNALKVIDKAIPSAILYIFEYKSNFAYGITLKENAQQRYYFSDWNEELKFDFTGNSIEHIYQKTIKLFISYKTGLEVKNENFENLIEKEKQLAVLNKEIQSLKNKIRAEKQFNKQLALNSVLKKKKEEKEKLTAILK